MRTVYRIVAVPLFVALSYLLIAGFAYAGAGLVWVFRHA